MDYSYHQLALVKKFNDGNGKKLSPGMQKIYRHIKNIAIDKLTVKEFRKFYESPHFALADFTEIKKENKVVGFLFATFYYNPNSSPQYTAKAFHAVAGDYRQTGKPYDRKELYNKFIEYYMEKILLLEFLKQGINTAGTWLAKGDVPTFQDLKNIISSSLKSANNKQDMQIEIWAENPTTYSDIFDSGLKYTGIQPTVKDLNFLSKLTPDQLLVESYKLAKSYKTNPSLIPQYLEETNFTVNISPKEWRNSFETNNKAKKFYLWQNFEFPNKAFKIIIPINPENILNAIFALIEKKGSNAINQFLQKNLQSVQNPVLKKILKSLTGNKNVIKIPSIVKNTIKKILGLN